MEKQFECCSIQISNEDHGERKYVGKEFEIGRGRKGLQELCDCLSDIC